MCCCALPAAALLTRPDRDDSEYLELASRYTSSVPLNAPAGEGVIVAPRWILTAASVAPAQRGRTGAAAIRIGARAYEVRSVHAHPTADLALVFLAEPLRDVEPTPIYREADEQGKGVVIAAHGPTGRIGERPRGPGDGRRRAAINTVAAAQGATLTLAIRAGDDASDLQGAGLPSEAGRPAYLETRGAIFVAGIGQRTEDANGDGIVGNAGDRETYARVSAFAEWIDETMFRAAQQEATRR